MSENADNSKALGIPSNAGRAIVDSAAMLVCPLLKTVDFAKFCQARSLDVDSARLLLLERLGLFAPVFRVRAPEEDVLPMRIPHRDGDDWFERGWAWDTTSVPIGHEIPRDDDRSQEGYYSVFQLDCLRLVLSQLTLSVRMDQLLAKGPQLPANWERSIANVVELTRSSLTSAQEHAFRPAVALLCQYISNRYYPAAMSDMRSTRMQSTTSWDSWIQVGDPRKSAEDHAARVDPVEVAARFNLNRARLRHAYETLARSQEAVDPLARWYPLVQFVAVSERERLKGKALLAETLRRGALMLRALHRNLYNEELPPPNEVVGTVINYIPELAVRSNQRRYLELVVNDYGLNPQPKLVLFVEGQSDEHAVHLLFERLFGYTIYRAWIEVVAVRGVDNATGGKEDRYRAIMRLIDYLHHRQTLGFVVLDNENNAVKLKREGGKMRSFFGHRNRVTRPEYIHVWKTSFEFDNFSDTELALCLTRACGGTFVFRRAEITQCRKSPQPGSALTRLYRQRTSAGLDKMRLCDDLVDQIFAAARRKVENRPIVKLLQRIAGLALRNPPPVTQEIYDANQRSRFLAKKS